MVSPVRFRASPSPRAFSHPKVENRAPWLAIVGPMADVVDLEHHSGALDRPRQVELAKIAQRQHGVVARHQLLALGFGRGAIRYKLAVGRLHSIHREVYAVDHANLTPRGRWMAAVLACGQGALLSHRSAAALWGFGSAAGTDIDVTATGRSRYGLPG